MSSSAIIYSYGHWLVRDSGKLRFLIRRSVVSAYSLSNLSIILNNSPVMGKKKHENKSVSRTGSFSEDVAAH